MVSILKRYRPPLLIIISSVSFWAAGCSRSVNHSISDKTPPDIISDLSVVDSGANSVVLSWTAPREGNKRDQAAKYDIRYAKSLITEANWEFTVVVGNLSSPSPAGEKDSSRISGLQGNTNYFFAIKSCDRSGNWSALSNNTAVRTGPEHIPAGVIDLIIESRTNHSVTLTWSAPAADDSSSPAIYDVRYSQKALNRFSWDAAETIVFDGVQGFPGHQEKMMVSNLSANTNYYFGLKSQCAGQEKWSDLSNIVSISTREDSSSVTLLGQFDSPGYAMYAALKDHYVFLADHTAGVEIIDVANPSVPILVKQIMTPGPARKISISGNSMAIIYSDPAGLTGIQLYDIYSPVDPKLLWQHQQFDLIQDVALVGGTIVMAEYSRKVDVMYRSTSDTLAPYCSVGIFDVPQELQTYGTYVLVADYAAGLLTINVRDPWFSCIESRIATGSLVRDVCAFGEHAMLACDVGGFKIVDITNPLIPFVVGSCDTPGQALSVAADGRYAYVADGAVGGIQVINILDFQEPYIVGHYPTTDVALSVVANGYTIYAAAGMAGLLILHFGSSANLNL